jgi:hypothetical protein
MYENRMNGAKAGWRRGGLSMPASIPWSLRLWIVVVGVYCSLMFLSPSRAPWLPASTRQRPNYHQADSNLPQDLMPYASLLRTKDKVSPNNPEASKLARQR